MGRISTGKGSKQNYQTPADFMKAVTLRFGLIGLDLAAEAHNTQSPRYFAPVTGPEGPMLFDPKARAMDAFDQKWYSTSRELVVEGFSTLLWLNPPFGEIEVWAERCVNESLRGCNILMLVPVGLTEWFRQLVVGQADIYLLQGRLSFIPGEPYTKDCMLIHYRPGSSMRSMPGRTYLWEWKFSKSLVLL